MTDSAKVLTGKIKTLADRGFGFISVEGQEKEVFFHSSSLVGVKFEELSQGDFVSFEIEQSDKGPRAINVQRVEQEEGMVAAA
ncbi:MAG: cold shock domain-containing protein [Candidatus Kerfeldbacteria bacterium]|nr:cold shock domain-containing protein [Candidatus Kerfeldbacteria bacterium]